MLVVSHDRYFLDRICDQIVAFEDTGVYVQPGNYSYYLEKRKQREQARASQSVSAASPPAVAPVSAPAKTARPRRLTFKEQRELSGMEAAIQASEARVSELEATLNSPDFYATRAREAPGLVAELEAARAEVTRLYARWAELDQIGK